MSKKTDKPIKPIIIFRKTSSSVRFGFGFVMLKPINPNRTEPVHIKRKGTINEKKMLYILT